MRTIIRTECLLIFALLPVMAHAQVVSGDRLHLEGWRNAGYPGGVPTPTTIVNVASHGALGDGSACDSAVSSAVSALGGGPGVVFFPAGTYLLQNTMTLPSGVVFRGERSSNTTLRFSCDNNCITVGGSLVGDSQAIVSGYSNHSSVITVPTGSVFQAGDFVEIKESNDPGYSWSSWAGDTVGQMAYIQSVSGNVVTLQTPLRIEYQASLSPMIRKSVPTTQVGFENLKFERLNSSYVTDNKMTILFDRAADCWVRGCEFYNGFGGHVGFYVSTRIDITGNDFHHAYSYGGNGNGYGVRLESRTGEVLVEDNLFYSLRHSILFQVGANGNVVAYNHSYGGQSSLSDITMHGNFPYANLVEGNICEFLHLDDSHYESGPHNTFLRNVCTKAFGGAFGFYYGGFLVTEDNTDWQNFVGNEATGCHLDATNHIIYGNNLAGNVVAAGTTNLPDISYYLGTNVSMVSLPGFWNITNVLPVIGIPHAYSTNRMIPARYRRVQGLSRTVAPPSLWLQPSNRTVAAGSPLSLSVQATGTPVAVFAWYRDGQLIADATVSVYQVGSAQAGDAGAYHCVISDAYGAISSRVATVSVTGGATGTVDFVQEGSAWRYFNNGTLPATNWFAENFNDGSWSNGPAPLGYGDPAIATTLGYGEVDTNKWMTTYFARSFTVANAGAVTGVLMRMIADDGALVYINGKLIHGSQNLSPSATNGTLTTDSLVEPYSWAEFTVSPTELHSGTNRIALQLHQSGPSTSDAYLDLALEPVAYVTTNQPGSVGQLSAPSGGVSDSWVAFNDLAWQAGETSNRITRYSYDVTGGPLVDYQTGTQLVARVDITTNEALSTFWIADATPLAGSDADFYFTSRVDTRGYLQGIVTLGIRVSNLNPAGIYSCVLFGNRGPIYTDRFTDVTISDLSSFENDSSVGSQLITATMAGDTTRILVGSNSLGQVWRFTNIVPGADGDFALTLTRALGGNAYLNALLVAAGSGDLQADPSGNGLPDSWETRYFGSTNTVQGSANADPDGDGFSNSDEYNAGTDPGSALSLLAVGGASVATNGTTSLSWSSVPGKIYSVQAASNLTQPWMVLQTSVTASPPMNVVTTPAAGVRQFIRVKVE